MDLDQLRTQWDRFGADDPLWAVLTTPEFRGGRWDPGAFFRTGRQEVRRVLWRLRGTAWRHRGVTLRHGRALDFGCGVGRVSQALARHFRVVDGVDIAPSMIEAARRFNRRRGCRYHVLGADGLAAFPAHGYDLVYTAHVLQHMEPRYAAGYVADLVRLVRPGGLGLFEVVTERVLGPGLPLPDEAFRAEVAIRRAPARLDAGADAVVEVEVTNRGTAPWPASGNAEGWCHVTIGNHWLTADGGPEVVDDGRVPLPGDLAPGEQARLRLLVGAPAEPGGYLLAVEPVQEGVGWFSERGCPLTAVPVNVRSAAGVGHRDRAAAGAAAAGMEMHGIPGGELTRCVEQAGGRVLEVFDWDRVSGRPSTDWRRRGFIVTVPRAG